MWYYLRGQVDILLFIEFLGFHINKYYVSYFHERREGEKSTLCKYLKHKRLELIL